MKVISAIFWTIVAIFFGAIAGIVIGGITLAASILMLRDAILSWCNHPSALRRTTNNQ